MNTKLEKNKNEHHKKTKALAMLESSITRNLVLGEKSKLQIVSFSNKERHSLATFDRNLKPKKVKDLGNEKLDILDKENIQNNYKSVLKNLKPFNY